MCKLLDLKGSDKSTDTTMTESATSEPSDSSDSRRSKLRQHHLNYSRVYIHSIPSNQSGRTTTAHDIVFYIQCR